MNFVFVDSITDDVINSYIALAKSVKKNTNAIWLPEAQNSKSAKEFLSDTVNDPKSALLLVYEGKELIGTGKLNFYHEISPHYVKISAVMVNPEQQGKGTGKQILEHLEEKAKQLGYTDIILNTWDIPALVAFYTHNGYKEVGRIPHLIANEGNLYDFYWFVKRIV